MKKLKLNLDEIKVKSYETTNQSLKNKRTIQGCMLKTTLPTAADGTCSISCMATCGSGCN